METLCVCAGQAATRAFVTLLKAIWVYLLHCEKYLATDDLQASSMEKPKSCFQFAEVDVSVKTDKHPTSSSQMSNFRIVSLSQQPEKECCCGGVTGKKYRGSRVCLLTKSSFLLLFF